MLSTTKGRKAYLKWPSMSGPKIIEEPPITPNKKRQKQNMKRTRMDQARAANKTPQKIGPEGQHESLQRGNQKLHALNGLQSVDPFSHQNQHYTLAEKGPQKFDKP
jgi:hypothetical protein